MDTPGTTTPAPPPRGPYDDLLLRRGPLFAALAVVMVLGALIHPWPDKFVFRNGGDCVRYLTWSRVVAAKGLFAFPGLVDEYRNRWVGFPPPTRWAWLLGIAGMMRLWPHASDEYHPLVFLSWVGVLLAVVPVALWLRRKAPAPVVGMAMLLVVTAPLGRALGHFPLPDALHATLTLVLFALVAAMLRAPKGWHTWAIGITTVAVLATREVGAINVIGTASLVLVDWRQTGTLKRGPLWALGLGCLAMVAITIPLAGGPVQLVLLAKDVVHAALFTSGALIYCSGPYYRYLVDFMVLSPVLVVTAIACIAPLRRRADSRALVDEVLAPTLVVLGLFSLLSKTLRYVMVVDTGMRILAALAVWALWRGPLDEQGHEVGTGDPRWRRFLAIALLIALVAHDLAIYVPLWGKDQIYDPVTWGLTKYLRMIPSWGPGPPLD